MKLLTVATALVLAVVCSGMDNEAYHCACNNCKVKPEPLPLGPYTSDQLGNCFISKEHELISWHCVEPKKRCVNYGCNLMGQCINKSYEVVLPAKCNKFQDKSIDPVEAKVSIKVLCCDCEYLPPVVDTP